MSSLKEFEAFLERTEKLYFSALCACQFGVHFPKIKLIENEIGSFQATCTLPSGNYCATQYYAENNVITIHVNQRLAFEAVYLPPLPAPDSWGNHYRKNFHVRIFHDGNWVEEYETYSAENSFQDFMKDKQSDFTPF